MKRRQKPPRPFVLSPAYRQAIERLDAALEENTPCDNTELIRLLREAYFADVDAFVASGKLVLPG